MFRVKDTKHKGRGLFATKDVLSGTILLNNHILVVQPNDINKLKDTVLNLYTFKYDMTRDCLVLGEGSLINHADDPNTSFKLVVGKSDGLPYMQFFVIKDVMEGEEFTIDYRSDDVTIDMSGYYNGKNSYTRAYASEG